MNENVYSFNLGQIFNNIAQDQDINIAIRHISGEVFTYKQLNELSNQIANYLLDHGILKYDVVAIFNNKSDFSYSLMIACLKIGAIYTNIDPKTPIERLKKIINNCNPKILFNYNEEIIDLSSFGNQDYIQINYDDSLFLNSIFTYSKSFPNYNKQVNSNNPAYIMFTSGSTGLPKGVLISHQNVINFINWSKNVFCTQQKDVFTNLNPMHFDNSVFDFYASLFAGASLISLNESLTRNPKILFDALNILKPTIWFSVPSLLVYALNMRAIKPDDLPSLKIISFGGEGFPKNQLRILWEMWKTRIKFINVYGPTECTCICSSYNVSQEDIDEDGLLPLGKIAPNFYALILNENMNKVKIGEMGELYIGGPNVGLGYYNEILKSNDVFIKNPFIKTHSEIIYKSGDLVKIDDNGNLLFGGRKDNQIKRMGYRIELEEIENALNSITFIKESAVVYKKNESFNSKIIACIVSLIQDDEKISLELKKYLPLYMMPDLIQYFEVLPKNQNGKIDRLKIIEIIE